MKLEFDPAEYLPLREVVFKTLRNAIIRGELPPGDRLMEEKLAKNLEVSRTPVRIASRTGVRLSVCWSWKVWW